MDQGADSTAVRSVTTSDLKSEKGTSLIAEGDSDEQDSSKTADSSAFSNKSWKTILATCVPIALICLLVWLDEGILATAIPRISDEFNSFDQIGWYGPSYLFGLCACQLPFGRAYKDFSSKVTYLISLLIFEVASVIQAAAPSSEAFIVGRVLAGVGGSGVLAGSLTIFSEEIPKAKLPYVMATFSWVQIIGGIAGPVIGGAISSSSLTWRWYLNIPSVIVNCMLIPCRCFYLNPILSGAVLIPVLYLWKGTFLPVSKDDKPSMKKIMVRFDYLGIVLFAAAVIALLLALQFGGSSYSWSDGRTIASLTTSGVFFLAFAAVEWWKGSDAMVPGKVIGKTVVSFSLIFTATLDGSYFTLTYQVCRILLGNATRLAILTPLPQIPLWFQSISGLSARDSGYHILPLLASCIFANMAGMILTGKLHYYQPFMLLGAVLLTVGSGLLTTLSPSAPAATWLVGEILAGTGAGLGSPLPLLAVQDALPSGDVPIGYTVVLTASYLGSSIALAIAQAVFASRLKHDILLQLPEVDPNAIVNAGATDLKNLIPGRLYEQGLQLFNMAMTQSWYMSVLLAGVSVFLVFGFKWKKMDMRDKK